MIWNKRCDCLLSASFRNAQTINSYRTYISCVYKHRFLDGTPKGTVYSHVHFEKSYNNWLPDYKQYDREKLGTKNREVFFYTHNKNVVSINRQYNCFSKTLVNQDIWILKKDCKKAALVVEVLPLQFCVEVWINLFINNVWIYTNFLHVSIIKNLLIFRNEIILTLLQFIRYYVS